MIKVTAEASVELKAMKAHAESELAGHECDPNTCGEGVCGGPADHHIPEGQAVMRMILLDSGHLALILDMYRDGDEVVEHEGERVLVMEAELAEDTSRLVFDCMDTLDGRELTIRELRSDEEPAA